MPIFSTKGGYTFHSLVEADLDELAGAVYLRQVPSSGQLFARKLKEPQLCEGKDKARHKIFKLIANWQRPLNVLTLPGLYWDFERRLIAHRMTCQNFLNSLYEGQPEPGHSYRINFVSYEIDPAIFRLSLKYMPRPRKHSFKLLSAYTVQTQFGNIFTNREVEKDILSDSVPEIDAAWLDYTGFLTPYKLEAILKLWEQPTLRLLAVTTLKARWEKAISKIIKETGSVGLAVASQTGGKIIQEYEYQDGRSPMNQFVLIKG